jgi:predicted  nucleic acid-binding Zn-ribbon protein
MRKFPLVVVLLLSAGLFGQNQTSSVADAAKAKSPKKARRVITNDDIPSKTEPETAPAEAKKETSGSSLAETAAEPTKSDAVKPATSEDSEAAKAAQKKVDDLKEHLNTIQQQIAETDKKIDSATDDQVRDALVSARDGKKEFAAELTKQLAAAEKELEAAKGTSEKPAEPAKDTAESKPPSK